MDKNGTDIQTKRQLYASPKPAGSIITVSDNKYTRDVAFTVPINDTYGTICRQ